MSASRVLGISSAALLCLAAGAATATAATPADRIYQIRSATTTVTLDNHWFDRLQSNKVRISAGEGARLTVRKPKGAAKVVRIVFRLRALDGGNQLVYGARGTWLTVSHRGTMTFTSADQPGRISFRRPLGVIADPNGFPGGVTNGLLAEIVRPSSAPRPPNYGTEQFLKGARVRIRQPKGGTVTVAMRNLRFDSSSALLAGTDPLSPAGSAGWFPRTAMGAVMGDGVTVLHVKRLS